MKKQKISIIYTLISILGLMLLLGAIGDLDYCATVENIYINYSWFWFRIGFGMLMFITGIKLLENRKITQKPKHTINHKNNRQNIA